MEKNINVKNYEQAAKFITDTLGIKTFELCIIDGDFYRFGDERQDPNRKPHAKVKYVISRADSINDSVDGNLTEIFDYGILHKIEITAVNQNHCTISIDDGFDKVEQESKMASAFRRAADVLAQAKRNARFLDARQLTNTLCEFNTEVGELFY